jgi:hypothetical protein
MAKNIPAIRAIPPPSIMPILETKAFILTFVLIISGTSIVTISILKQLLLEPYWEDQVFCD